eukprot:scaffold123633_cov31-Tisochrysis_lutea.AAC.2
MGQRTVLILARARLPRARTLPVVRINTGAPLLGVRVRAADSDLGTVDMGLALAQEARRRATLRVKTTVIVCGAVLPLIGANPVRGVHALLGDWAALCAPSDSALVTSKAGRGAASLVLAIAKIRCLALEPGTRTEPLGLVSTGRLAAGRMRQALSDLRTHLAGAAEARIPTALGFGAIPVCTRHSQVSVSTQSETGRGRHWAPGWSLLRKHPSDSSSHSCEPEHSPPSRAGFSQEPGQTQSAVCGEVTMPVLHLWSASTLGRQAAKGSNGRLKQPYLESLQHLEV